MMSVTDNNAAVATAAGQYLSFSLGAENYGIDILKVQEIRSYEAPTRMPGSHGDLLGVVNLRGVIVPIHDLRLRFQCPSAEVTPSTVVIVIDLGARVIGVVVDAVRDVVALGEAEVRPAPGLGDTAEAGFVRGLAQVGERMLILLDIEALLSGVALPEVAAEALAA